MLKKILFCLLLLITYSVPAFAWLVPDTGQTKCCDDVGREITCPNPGEPFYGQGGNYSINPRSYTKLNAKGNDLPVTANAWTMVRDNVTGLIWEVKTDDGSVRDKDNKYTWYDSNPATNSGEAGYRGDGTDTEDFINELNAQNYGGHSDWRMPTLKELTSITNKGRVDPAIDTWYFPNTKTTRYWSSTPNAAYPVVAWMVHFGSGHGYYVNKSGSYYVRAVRGGQSVVGSIDNLVINGDNTVTDNKTGLMWPQKTTNNAMNWENSLVYCENLSLAGYNDWRLPTVEELRSIIDYNKYDPAIDTRYFPNTDSFEYYYWSSTTHANSSGRAWIIQFNEGDDIIKGDKSRLNYVRAVRSKPYGSTYDLIEWGNRPYDTFYCLDICDENWNVYPGFQAIECGEGLSSWSPRHYINNVLGMADPSGFRFNWRVWSQGGYGGAGFEGEVVVP